MDYEELDNISLSINGSYPDFVDSFIEYAEKEGVPLTDDELDELNEDSEFVYQLVIDHYF